MLKRLRLWVFWIGLTLTGASGVWSLTGSNRPLPLELDTVSLYVTVVGTNGAVVQGLPPDAFEIQENGIPQTVEAAAALPADSGLTQHRQRWVVFFFSSSLDLREMFRAKRGAAWLAAQMKQGVSIAVLRDSRLSPFEAEPFSRRFLLRYFGAGDGLRDILVSRLPSRFQSASDTRLDWQPSDMLSKLIEQGAEGRPLDLLSALKHLAGRKQIVYFGTAVPERNWDDPLEDEFLDPQVLSDAGFELYAINVHPQRPGGASAPQDMMSWAAKAAGVAVNLSAKPARELSGLSKRMDSGYWLRYRPRRKPDCRYRAITVTVHTEQPVQLSYRPGYFATRPAALPLVERTLATVLADPKPYRDFPLSLAGLPLAEPAPSVPSLRVVLSFPLAAVRMEKTAQGNWQQELAIYIGVFDKQGRRVGGIYRTLAARTEEVDLESFSQQTATLNEVMKLSTEVELDYLEAVVIVGHNRQISVQQYALDKG